MIQSLHIVGKDEVGQIVWDVPLSLPISLVAMRQMAVGYAIPTPLCREGEPNLIAEMIVGVVLPEVQKSMEKILLTAVRKILETEQ